MGHISKMSSKDVIQDLLDLDVIDEQAVTIDGFDDAVVGATSDGRLVYDYYKIVEIMIENDKVDATGAIEYIDYNIVRALYYYGQHAPVIMYSLKDV